MYIYHSRRKDFCWHHKKYLQSVFCTRYTLCIKQLLQEGKKTTFKSLAISKNNVLSFTYVNSKQCY